MNKNIGKWLFLMVGVVVCFVLTSAYASNNFVKVSLPIGVSIELPKNWVVFSKDQRINLDTLVESGLDLAGLEQVQYDFPFAANYYKNGKTVGIINTRYYPSLDLTQNDARQATLQDVNELDTALKEGIVKSLKVFGKSILSWKGTKKITINGITAFVTEYRRKAKTGTGAFRVRLVRIFAGYRSFTLTVSYDEEESFFLKTITDKIISSLRLSDINEESVVKNEEELDKADQLELSAAGKTITKEEKDKAMSELVEEVKSKIEFPIKVDEMTSQIDFMYSKKYEALIYVHEMKMTEAAFDSQLRPELLKMEAIQKEQIIKEVKKVMSNNSKEFEARRVFYKGVLKVFECKIAYAYVSSDGKPLFYVWINVSDIF